MSDVRAKYLRKLEESRRPRTHWRGVDPDDTQAEWLFETVEESGEHVAVKQVIVEPNGAVHRYSWERLEDSVGFLTDQPVKSGEGLEVIPGDDFARRWGT